MNSRILEGNLAALRESDPILASKISGTRVPENYEVTLSKSGKPVLKTGNIRFHSAYHPEEEGERFLREHEGADSKTVVVFGIGFGYHLSRLFALAKEPVSVVEPRLEILRALFEQIDCRDWIPGVRIVVPGDQRSSDPGDGLRRFWRELRMDSAILAVHKPSAQWSSAAFDLFRRQWKAKSILAETRLKILVVGPSYGGSLPTAHYVERALRNLGHDVVLADSSRFQDSYQKINEVTKNQLHLAQLKSLYVNFMGEAVAAAADEVRPDLVIALAQAPLSGPVIDRLKTLGIPVAFWFVEDFRTLKYWESVGPRYDYFFSIQRGEFFNRLERAGIKNYYYLPQACSPDVHRPLTLTPEEMKQYGSDVSFMGAGYRNRKEFFKGLLDFDFSIWGTEWDLSTQVGRRVRSQHRRLGPEEYVKIFNASKINLNLHSSGHVDGVDPVGDFVNPRTFEIAACGGFQLADFRGELPPLMEEGEEIVCFRTLEEAREKIHGFLKDPEGRAVVAERGRKRVLADHTFEHRLSDMLHIVLTHECDRILDKREREKGLNHVDRLLGEAKDDPELRDFLERFRGEGNLRLRSVMEKIYSGKGEIRRPESIFLMLNEILSEEP